MSETNFNEASTDENRAAVAVPVELCVIRKAKNRQERLYAELNSTDDDLYPQNGRVVITGKNKDGEIIELGCVCEVALYKKGVNPRFLIDKVRFGV